MAGVRRVHGHGQPIGAQVQPGAPAPSVRTRRVARRRRPLGPRPDKIDLAEWRHLTALGRDAYVRVVYVGYLVGFGHNAALVKVTERKFESLDDPPQGKRVAVLRQRKFIVAIRKRVMEYDGSGHVHGGRNFPFKRVEILTESHARPHAARRRGRVGVKAKIGEIIYTPPTKPGETPPKDPITTTWRSRR